jgi:hypothetical protein
MANNDRKLVAPFEPPSYERLSYDELPKPDMIRLLRKHTHDDPRVYHCTMEVFDMDNVPPYTALSYTWGTPAADTELHDEYQFAIICNDRLVHVTENLFMALRRFHTLPDTYLWIDQICIDQDDLAEKSTQVARMGTIFANAAGAYIWLGEQDETAEKVFDILRNFVPAYCRALYEGRISKGYIRYGDPSFWKEIGLPSWTNEQANAIIHFFNRSWFERAWCIQEVVLAKDVAVCCGGLAINWMWLSLLSMFLHSSQWYNVFQNAKNQSLAPLQITHTARGDLRKAPDSMAVGMVPMSYSKLRDLCEEQYSRGMATRPKVRSTVQITQLKQQFYSLLAAMLLPFRFASSTRPEDKVYAPLALVTQLLLCEADRNAFLKTDYTMSTVDMYTLACREILIHTQSLSLLCQVEDASHRRLAALPSWVPDFSCQMVPSVTLGQSTNEFPFLPETDCMAGRHMEPRISVADNILSVRASFLDSVEEALPNHAEAYFNLRPSLWFDICLKLEERYFNGHKRIEVLWRTMICDRDADGQSPADDVVSGWVLDFFQVMIAGSIDMEDRWERDDSTGKMCLRSWPQLDALAEDSDGSFPSHSQVWDFAQEVEAGDDIGADCVRHVELFNALFQNARSMRRIFRTSKNMLGQGPLSLLPGDAVAFVAGCPVPVILRPISGKRYRFIGETYVHACMQGSHLQTMIQTFTDIELV